MHRLNRLRTVLVTLILVVILPTIVLACPTCKDGLSGDPATSGMVRGYFWSIVFMMSMPFLILGGISAYFYYEVRRARALAQQASVESAPVASEAVASETIVSEVVLPEVIAQG